MNHGDFYIDLRNLSVHSMRFWGIILLINLCSIPLSGYCVWEDGELDPTVRQKVDSLNTESSKLVFANIRQSYTLAEQALTIAQKQDYQKGSADAYLLMGKCLRALGKYDSAIWVNTLANEIFFQISDNEGIANSYNAVGTCHALKGQVVEAIRNFILALEYVEKTDNLRSKAECYHNIARQYMELGQYSSAIPYFFKAEEICKKIDHPMLTGLVNLNIGTFYLRMQKDTLAENYLHHAIKISKAAGDSQRVAMGILFLGELYQKQLKIQEAKRYTQIALNKLIQYKDPYQLAIACLRLGAIHTELKDYDRADACYKDALVKAEGIQSLSLLTKVHAQLAIFYRETQQFEQALYHQTMNNAFSDSVQNIVALTKMDSLKRNYDFQQKELENRLLQANVDKQFTRSIFIAILAATLFVLSIVLWFGRREAILRRKRLASQAIELEAAKLQLTSQNEILETKVKERTEELSTSNAELKHFVEIASHHFQQPMALIAGYAYLLQKKKDRLDPVETNSYLEAIIAAVFNMKEITRGFIHYTQISSPEDKQKVSYCGEILMKDILQELNPLIESSKAEVHIAEPLPGLFMDRLHYYYMIHHPLHNSLTYISKNRKPYIEIFREFHQDALHIYIRDNGIGIPEKYLSHAFKLFSQLLAGDIQRTGIGMGLSVCKKIVESYKGTISLHSVENEGTTIKISLPIQLVSETIPVR